MRCRELLTAFCKAILEPPNRDFHYTTRLFQETVPQHAVTEARLRRAELVISWYYFWLTPIITTPPALPRSPECSRAPQSAVCGRDRPKKVEPPLVAGCVTDRDTDWAIQKEESPCPQEMRSQPVVQLYRNRNEFPWTHTNASRCWLIMFFITTWRCTDYLFTICSCSCHI